VSALLLAGAVAVMVNYLAYKHVPLRWDISSTGHFRLSDKTRGVLAEVEGELRIITVFKQDEVLFDEVRYLLKEYAYAASGLGRLHLHVEHVDPDRDLARTREVAREFDVQEPNIIIVAHGPRHRVIEARQLVDYERLIDFGSGGQPLVRRKKLGFRGEEVISSAIQALAQARTPHVYFLRGHGERNIEEYSDPAGYAHAVRLLKRDNIVVSSLLLAEAGGVPEDCDALIVAGPARQLAAAEVNLIADYLERHGRLLLFIDAGTTTGMEKLLEKWGVKLAPDVVVGLTLTGRELFVPQYGDHPITRRLANVVTMFYAPRSVEPAAEPATTSAVAADRPRVTVLAACSEDGWEMDPGQSPSRFDEGSTAGGPAVWRWQWNAARRAPSASI